MYKIALVALLAFSLGIAPAPMAFAEKVSVLSSPNPTHLQNRSQSDNSAPLIKQGRVQTRFLLPSRTSIWQKNYINGLEALNERKFKHAEKMLLAAVKSAKGPMTQKINLVESRLALGKLYLLEGRYSEAYSIYKSTIAIARSCKGSQSRELAECHYGLARTEVQFGDLKKAKEDAEAAVEMLRDLKSTDSQLFGSSIHVLGLTMAKFGWYEDAKSLFKPAVSVMEEHPGYQNLDLADVLMEQSLFYHNIGMKEQSLMLYEKAYKIKEKFVQPTKSPSVVGEVHFVWEQGSTRAKEIIDNEFPFRFMTANGVRVAATVIDLWELLGVLVTVTNITDKQRELELGQVELLRVAVDNPKKKAAVVPPIDPESIDRVQKELSIWSLTHTRPWLANIQKTRTMRGFVPSRGHDLFMGPNVFGVYGKWKAVSHTVPLRVGLQPSRERVLDLPDTKKQSMPGLMLKGNYKTEGVYPVWLEPFESRTGELFYLNPRDCDVVVKVPVGNAIFELPFHTRKKFPH